MYPQSNIILGLRGVCEAEGVINEPVKPVYMNGEAVVERAAHYYNKQADWLPGLTKPFNGKAQHLETRNVCLF